MRRFAGPVAAAMLGAATLPAMAGATVPETPDSDGPRAEVVVSAPVAVIAPASAARSQLMPGSLQAEGLYGAHLQDRLRAVEARARQFEATAPDDPNIATDLAKLHQVVAQFDRLIQEDAALPSGLLVDLDHLLDALEDAQPGELQAKLDDAWRTLPSGRATLDVAAPASPRISGPGRSLRDALTPSSPTDFPNRAQAVIAEYTAIMNGADAVTSRLPDFRVALRNPLVYDSGDGKLVIPPGAQIVKNGADFTIEAQNLLWARDGMTVVAQDAAIELGGDLDGLRAGQVSASGDDWTANLHGATIGLSRDRGFALVEAERLNLHLTDGTAHLSGARLLVGASGDATLDARRVQVTQEGFDLDLTGLHGEQTREGTDLQADRLRYRDGGTLIRGESIDLQFGPNGTQLSSAQLHIESGASVFDATNASLTSTPIGSRGQGGHRLALTGDAFSFQHDRSSVTASGGGALNMVLDGDGQLRSARVEGADLQIATSEGQASLTQAALEMTLDEQGRLTRLNARGDDATFAGDGFDLNARQGRLDLAFDEAGHLSRLTGDAARVTHTGGDGVFDVQRGKLAVHFEDGRLQQLTSQAGSASWRGADGTRVDAERARLSLDFHPETGGLANATLALGKATFADADHRLDLSGTSLHAAFDPSGRLTSATGESAELTYHGAAGTFLGMGDVRMSVLADGDQIEKVAMTFDSATLRGDFGTLALAGGNGLSIEHLESGAARIDGHATRLDLAHDGGRLDLDGGLVQGQWTPEGTLESLRLSADHLGYEGVAEGDHPLQLDLQGPIATIEARAEGGQRLSFASEGGHMVVEGHQVGLDGAQQVVLETTTDGQIDAFSADFPGQVDFVERDGDLSVLTRDAHAQYDREGSRVRLDFGAVDVALRSEGLQAHIQGASAELDDSRFVVQVDKAHVLRELGEQLDVEVEALTVEVTRGAEGNLQAFDLALGGLEAKIDAMNVMVRTPSGERVRLHVSADEEGRTIKQAYLQIPEGGEVRITKDDLDVRLGRQRIAFTHGDDGVYRLRGDGVDIHAITKGAEVQIDSGTAQVSLDPNTGRLVIDEITGTHVDVVSGDAKIRLDVEELRGFMVQMTGFEGGATGAAVHLVPTEDGSRLTASLHGEVGGIPVELRVDDAHELMALAQVSVNQVYVYAGDPSGQGEIQIGVGPVKIEGSALEVIGRYHPYDPARMTESVHQFVTTSGAKLFSGVSYEPDGVLRLGTDREGTNAELAVLLSRESAVPGYRLDFADQPSVALGFVGSLGYRTGDLTLSGFAGALPGSQATLHVRQGDVQVAGIDVPKQSALPTTAVAGLRLDLAGVDNGDLGLVLGGYVNPAGLVDSPYLQESTPYGGFGGLEYTKDNWSISGSAVIDVDQNGGARLGGATLRLGIRF